jgi:hypothetical protein
VKVLSWLTNARCLCACIMADRCALPVCVYIVAGDFVSRHKADVVSFGAGIPGYSGFKPHGATVLWGDRPGSPPLEPHLGLGGNSSLDLSKQP